MTSQDLKNSILQLAMQGKLVPQNHEDESASALIKQIKAEKAKLIEQGRIKKEKTLPSITDEEIPFDIPTTWRLIHIGDFCSIYNGDSINATVKKEKYSKQCAGLSFIATKDVGFDSKIEYDNGVIIPFEEDSFKIAESGSVLLCMEGGSAGRKIGILDQDVCFGNKLCCFNPIIVLNKFLFYYLQSPQFFSFFIDSKTGLIGGVGTGKLKLIVMPLPPLEEQRRIVEKIEELMPLVEEYGKAQERLTALNAEFPDKLRKSILQQAIQGKITECEPADEPASELLERIRAEKEQLIKDGKIKKETTLSNIIEEEIPFDVPNNWCWVRLGDFVCVRGGKRMPKGKSLTTVPTEHIYIRVTDMQNGTILDNDLHYVPDEVYPQISKYIIEKDDLYIVIVGSTIGKTGVVPEKFDKMNLTENAVRLTPVFVNKLYLKIALETDMVQTQLMDIVRQEGQPKLAIMRLRSALIPIPPLAEQQRIVDRVNELLALCDELK